MVLTWAGTKLTEALGGGVAGAAGAAGGVVAGGALTCGAVAGGAAAEFTEEDGVVTNPVRG